MNRRVYAYVSIYPFLYAHTRILIRTYAYTFTHIRVYLYEHIRTYAYIYTRIMCVFLVNVYLSGTVRKKESVVTRCTLPVLAGYVPLIMLLLLPYQSKLNPAVDATSCF